MFQIHDDRNWYFILQCSGVLLEKDMEMPLSFHNSKVSSFEKNPHGIHIAM